MKRELVRMGIEVTGDDPSEYAVAVAFTFVFTYSLAQHRGRAGLDELIEGHRNAKDIFMKHFPREIYRISSHFVKGSIGQPMRGRHV